MPLTNHPSFDRPLIATRLWRYVDLSKFIDLLTSSTLWLTNAEVLAQDDPYEGLPSPFQFPHRTWRRIEDVPGTLSEQIVRIHGKSRTPQEAFKIWFMGQEQLCYMTLANRRHFYVNCWHASEHESAAMWKIYASPGAGLAIVSNGGRIGAAISAVEQEVHLGAVSYQDPRTFQIGYENAFDSLMVKRANYAYEQEVRLVLWETGNTHDALVNFSWNEDAMRFEDVVEDTRPIEPGRLIPCNVDTLVERVVISPYAPSWYLAMIKRLRDQLRFKFSVTNSKLLSGPTAIP